MLWKIIQGNVHIKSFTFSLESPNLPLLAGVFEQLNHFTFLTSTVWEGRLGLASAGWEIAVAAC